MDYDPRRVAVDRLHFDPDNPRLPPAVDKGDERSILEWLLRDSDLVNLATSIATQGYFPGEPLLAVATPEDSDGAIPTPSADQHYIVVEGNRRIAAIKVLRDPAGAPRRRRTLEEVVSEALVPPPDDVPVIVFGRRDDVLAYLGYRHITGIKDWDSLEKARYLAQLRDRYKDLPLAEQMRSLARLIGSRSDYVGKLLAGLYSLDEIAKDEGLTASVNVEEVPFSVLTTSFNYRAVLDYVGIDDINEPHIEKIDTEKLRSLGRWLFLEGEDGSTAIEGDSRNLGYLATAISQPSGRTALDGGKKARDAALLTYSPEAVLTTALSQAERQLKLALDTDGELTGEGRSTLGRVEGAVGDLFAKHGRE